jgi:hypothetical protein
MNAAAKGGLVVTREFYDVVLQSGRENADGVLFSERTVEATWQESGDLRHVSR